MIIKIQLVAFGITSIDGVHVLHANIRIIKPGLKVRYNFLKMKNDIENQS